MGHKPCLCRPSRLSAQARLSGRSPFSPSSGLRRPPIGEGLKQLGVEMVAIDRKAHWEAVYSTKGETGVSWYQDEPRLSLELIRAVAPGHGWANHRRGRRGLRPRR